MFINARSIKTCTPKSNQLQMYHNSKLIEKPAIFGIVETWLNDNVSDQELAVENYTAFWKDKKSRGGDLLLNICNDFPSKRLIHLSLIHVYTMR